MKQERTQNPKQKPYPLNPQARPDYQDDDEHLPGQRQHSIEAEEGSGVDFGNRSERSDKKASRRQQGNASRKN